MKRTEIKKRPLSDTVLTSLEPEATEYRELDGNGLYLRVKPDGSKSWQLRYKQDSGKWSWMGLGGYGKGPHQLTGAQARKKAAELLDDAAGMNPLTTKRARQAAEAEATNNTFERLAREWHGAKQKEWTEGTAFRTLRALEKHVFPTFGKRPYTTILPVEWRDLFQRLQEAGITEQAARIRTLCRDIYDLARVTGRATHNPVEGLHKFMQTHKSENYKHVPIPELPELLRAIRSYGTTDVRIGLQLLAMLGCRSTELRAARWEEIDFDSALWSVPADRMKKRREYLVPLPTQAMALLRELHNITGAYPLLFPGRSDTTKARSNTVFLMALRRLGYEGRQTGHGFRHLASTILNENGFDSQHVEAQLSHAKRGVRGVYDKSTYLEQRRTMMQWYADHLDRLAAGNVVGLRRA